MGFRGLSILSSFLRSFVRSFVHSLPSLHSLDGGVRACVWYFLRPKDGSSARSVIFFGVRIRLVKVLGPFSIYYFRGLGLRIRVRVRVWVRVRVRVRVRV